MKKQLSLAAVLFSMTASMAANAFTTLKCDGNTIKWANNTITYYAYKGSFPDDSGEKSALNEAFSRLNANASNFKFTVIYDWVVPVQGNGRSEIKMANISYPGVTYPWYYNDCSSVFEMDIVMDTSVNWTTSIVKTTQFEYGGSGRPMQTTILHELGHAIGLGHEADEYNIMGQDWDHISTNGNSARAYFGEDANDGAVFLYGSDGTQDLGVVHYKYDPSTVGAYSKHTRTLLKDPSTNAELPYTWIKVNGNNSEKRYNVKRGQLVRAEFTFENNGNNYQYQDVGYYLSKNSYISQYDQLIKTRNIGLSPDNVYTSSYDITIPSDAKCNTPYWLGAKIDKNSSLSEYHEFNNASYIPVKVGWDWTCWSIQTPNLEWPTKVKLNMNHIALP